MRIQEIRAASDWRFKSTTVAGAASRALFFIALSAALVINALAEVSAPAPSSPADSLGEIIVTAQKRSKNLQDVPIAITAVTGDQLQAANLVSANDLPTLVSGLSIGDTALYFQPHLRGIGTAAFGPGVENPVALYVDGVYYPSQLEAPTDLIDVSQISVLKGPQGSSRNPLWPKFHGRRHSDDHQGSATEFWWRGPDFAR
jgi:iron complex outermembrane receptor protein